MPDDQSNSRNEKLAEGQDCPVTLTLRGEVVTRRHVRWNTVTVDLPDPLPVTEAEVQMVESFISDLIAEMLTWPDTAA